MRPKDDGLKHSSAIHRNANSLDEKSGLIAIGAAFISSVVHVGDRSNEIASHHEIHGSDRHNRQLDGAMRRDKIDGGYM